MVALFVWLKAKTNEDAVGNRERRISVRKRSYEESTANPPYLTDISIGLIVIVVGLAFHERS